MKDLSSCPVCGTGIAQHSPESKDSHESWLFDCGAEIVKIGKWLTDEEPCEEALRRAIQKINKDNGQPT